MNIKKIISQIKFVLLNLPGRLQGVEERVIYESRAVQLRQQTLTSTLPGISEEKYCAENITISLTSFDKRIHEVCLTIESLMQQSMKPNRIVLWLAEDMKSRRLPMTLRAQQKRGLEIHYCKDTRSYKKLLPTLQLYPDDVIITTDDDVIYDFDMIDRLVMAYISDPSKIYYQRGHVIKRLPDGKPDLYANWNWCDYDQDHPALNFPTGIGGILYPPHCFNDEVFNEAVWGEICKYADDIWFKAMALHNGIKCQKVYTRSPSGEDFLLNPAAQIESLSLLNNGKSLNDIQIKEVFEKYDLYKKLR